MHIYFKKTKTFTENIRKEGTEAIHYLGSDMVFEYESMPHIKVPQDFDLLKHRQELPECFLKATIIAYPEYTAGGINRTFGIYKYGKAKAELTPGYNKSNPYCLKIETSDWTGIADMQTLQEKLWAGSIAPTISYNTQLKQHPLQILAQILDSRKLSGWKRFILALRLIKSKPSC